MNHTSACAAHSEKRPDWWWAYAFQHQHVAICHTSRQLLENLGQAAAYKDFTGTREKMFMSIQERKCFCVKPATEQNAWSCTSPNVKALEEGGADGWTILALFRIKFFYFVLWETWLACLTAPSSLMWDRCPALSRRSAGLNNVRVAIWKGFGTTRTCVC
jgi:hypothetical protein